MPNFKAFCGQMDNQTNRQGKNNMFLSMQGHKNISSSIIIPYLHMKIFQHQTMFTYIKLFIINTIFTYKKN